MRSTGKGGEEVGGIPILGTLDETTGEVKLFNGPSVITPPAGGNGGNGGNGRGGNERGGGNSRGNPFPRPVGDPVVNPGGGRVFRPAVGNRSDRFNRRQQ